MGYTHYWYRYKEIDKATWALIEADCRKVLEGAEAHGLKLAGWDGTGRWEVDADHVDFNGSETCGHLNDEEISIPWPTKTASGVAGFTEDGKAGTWFAGTMLETRQCDGDCSFETFRIERVKGEQAFKTDETDATGLYFDCCKTAFRPYDIAVTACLIVLKHHLVYRCRVSSDGEQQHWFDGMMLCQETVGYGLEFNLEKAGQLA